MKKMTMTEIMDGLDAAMEPIRTASKNNYPYMYGNLLAWTMDAIWDLPAAKQKEFLAHMAKLNNLTAKDIAV